MRGMRLAKREITDEVELRGLVNSCQVLRIGAVDDEGVFVVPVNYGYEWHGLDADSLDDGSPIITFYIHSAREGRKAECFRANGDAGVEVAIELDTDGGNIVGSYSCAYSRSYASIMGMGHVIPVEDETEKVRALTRIMEHAAPGAQTRFEPEAVARVAIFRIDVTQLTGKKREP